MNLPSGTTVKTGIDVATVDFIALLRDLKSKLFSGYLCMAVKGNSGIEEGVLVFEDGNIAACFYDYLRYSKQLYGDQAFPRLMNASSAKHGVIDVFQLSRDQVQLIIAFNEQAICVPDESSIRRLKTESFSTNFEDAVKGSDASQGKNSLMKKYGISEVEKSETEKLSSEEEEDLLRDLVGDEKKEEGKKKAGKEGDGKNEDKEGEEEE